MKLHNVSTGGDRLDIYMKNIISDVTRSQIQFLIKSKYILVNGKQVKPSYIVRDSDIIKYEKNIINSDDSVSDNISFEDINLVIIYEDDSIVVIDKPSGLVVHPGAGNRTGTLLNGLINKISKSGFGTNPGIVHRLDKETSGVIVVAKNYKVHSNISLQFEKRTINKIYYALVWGNIDSTGTVEGNIIRKYKDRKSFTMTDKEGRYSKTKFKKIKNFGPISFVKLIPLTGRTHQIRVHMKSIGHPIISDSVYSGGEATIKSFHVKYTQLLKTILKVIPRVALHAGQIEILHPETNRQKCFSASLPDDMNRAIDILENYEQI